MEIIFVTGIHPSTVFFLLDLFWLFILGILERLTIQARPYLLCSFIWMGLAVNLQNQMKTYFLCPTFFPDASCFLFFPYISYHGCVWKVRTQDPENFNEEVKSLVSAWRPFLFSYLYLGARHKIPIKDLFPSSSNKVLFSFPFLSSYFP